MGHGNYSYEAHQALTQARAAAPVQQVFKQREGHASMNPYGVRFRESRDSAGHPSSLGIVFALDVSGSMGEIPEQLARKELPGFVQLLLDCGVTDPQVLFMAVSDVRANKAPLQVGQFESTAELMDKWLTSCWLEGGGMMTYESYELAMYFAARHTVMDCFEKRRRKGYMFITGDEIAYPEVKRDHVAKVLGTSIEADIRLEDIIAELLHTFEPFFLVPDARRASGISDFWRKHLGERLITMTSPADTCLVAASLVAVTERAVGSLPQLRDRLEERVGANRAAEVAATITPFALTLGVR